MPGLTQRALKGRAASAHEIAQPHRQIRTALSRAHKPCNAFGADARVFVEEADKTFYPDASVVCGKRQVAFDALTNPIVIVEVLSDSTEKDELRSLGVTIDVDAVYFDRRLLAAEPGVSCAVEQHVKHAAVATPVPPEGLDATAVHPHREAPGPRSGLAPSAGPRSGSRSDRPIGETDLDAAHHSHARGARGEARGRLWPTGLIAVVSLVVIVGSGTAVGLLAPRRASRPLAPPLRAVRVWNAFGSRCQIENGRAPPLPAYCGSHLGPKPLHAPGVAPRALVVLETVLGRTQPCVVDARTLEVMLCGELPSYLAEDHVSMQSRCGADDCIVQRHLVTGETREIALGPTRWLVWGSPLSVRDSAGRRFQVSFGALEPILGSEAEEDVEAGTTPTRGGDSSRARE